MKNREIERKFLVVGDAWRESADGRRCRQGYVLFGPPVSVRVRLMGETGYLTIKQAPSEPQAPGAPVERVEYEYDIPPDEARSMLDTVCGATVEKLRYRVPYEGHVWEIDEFEGANAGLVVAEIELESAGTAFEKPEWAGRDVSNDPRYLNVNLARCPYRQWSDS